MKKNLIILFLLFGYSFCKAGYDVNDVLIEGDSSLMGMKIESSYFSDGAFLIETTGARFEYVKGELKLYQGLDSKNRRLLSTIIFENEPNFIKVESNDDHIIFWSKDLNIGIYGDSTLIISPKKPQYLKCKGNFKPDYEGRYKGELLLIDDKGGMEIYPQRYEAGYEIKNIELGRVDWVADYELNAGERVMIAAFPGRPFDWEGSLNNNIIITYGCTCKQKNIYGKMPPEETIKAWSENFQNIVIFFQGLYSGCLDLSRPTPSGPYEIAQPADFKRFVNDIHKYNMKAIPYCSPFYFIQKERDMQKFYDQIVNLKFYYNIDGVYIDGILFDDKRIYSKLDDKIKSYSIIRELKKKLGKSSVLIYHGTSLGSPVGTIPNVDTYCTATLYGEGIKFKSLDDSYIRYQVKKYGISNTIGLWKKGPHPQSISVLDIIDAEIDMNCRKTWGSFVSYDDNLKNCRWSTNIDYGQILYRQKLKAIKLFGKD